MEDKSFINETESNCNKNYYRNILNNEGFVIVKDFFTPQEIINFRKLIYFLLTNNPYVNKYIKTGKDKGKWCLGNITQYSELQPLTNIINTQKPWFKSNLCKYVF